MTRRASLQVKTKMNVEAKEKLIFEIKKRPAIWDKRLQAHADRVLVQDQWDEIADTLNTPKIDCKKSWKNLVDQFRLKYYSIMDEKKGRSTADVSKTLSAVKWVFFKQMMFMKDMMSRRSNIASDFISLASLPSMHCLIRTLSSILSVSTFSNAADKPNNTGTEESAMDDSESPRDEFVESVTLETSLSPVSLVYGPSCSSMPVIQSVRSTQRASRPKERHAKSASSKANNDDMVTSLNQSILADRLDVIGRALRSTRSDSPSIFGDYLVLRLRKVPTDLRSECEQQLLDVVNSYVNGRRAKVVNVSCGAGLQPTPMEDLH